MADDTIKVDILTDVKSSVSSVMKYTAAIGGAYLAVSKMIKASKQYIDAYRIQEQAEAKLRSTLKATGNAAGFSFDQLKNYASGLQSVTTYGDEATISGLSVLSTFKSIRGEAFERTAEAALDLSAVMGQDLQSSMVQLGKAVEDPTVGLSALSRVGVTFTQQEKDQIKALQESNQLREAQAVILTAVEGQFKGAAKALAETDTGKLVQLNNALGDLKEALGKEIITNIVPFAGWLKAIATNATEALTSTRSFAEYLKTGVSSNSMEGINAQIEGAKRRIDSLKLSVDAFGEVTNPAALKEAEAALNALEQKRTRLRRTGEGKDANIALMESVKVEQEVMKTASEEKAAIAAQDLENNRKLQELYILDQEAYIATMAEKDNAYVAAGKALQDQQEEDAKEHFKNLTSYYEGYTSKVTDAFGALGERMGESIVEQESMWDATGIIVRDAIAGIIRAMGSEALVESAKNFAKGFASLANPFTASLAGGYFAAGAKWAAVGTLASAAAGAVTAKFAQGGEFTTSGPQMIMVGDNATGRERVKVDPLGASGGESRQPIHVMVNLDGKTLFDAVSRASNDGRVIINARSVR